MEMNNEQRDALSELALVICANAQDEADATAGYQKQLAAISRAIELMPDASEFLTKLYSATEEKISDELNHSHSLLAEYQELTGIKPAED